MQEKLAYYFDSQSNMCEQWGRLSFFLKRRIALTGSFRKGLRENAPAPACLPLPRAPERGFTWGQTPSLCSERRQGCWPSGGHPFVSTVSLLAACCKLFLCSLWLAVLLYLPFVQVSAERPPLQKGFPPPSAKPAAVLYAHLFFLHSTFLHVNLYYIQRVYVLCYTCTSCVHVA